MIIKNANPDDHIILTGLVKKSKAFWGYPPSIMKKWDNDLTISSDYILKNVVCKLIFNNTIVGCYSFIKKSSKLVELDFFFILPAYIGKGLGTFMMNDLFKRLKLNNIEIIKVISDPNAENFYKKFGFTTIQKKESLIEGRFLPNMEKYL
ncbi:GNAT family N-acetyltransferase [Abyssalbus ytuae]|uniref:GNAT family N-acetyltransferase n=1 Tax=Abyssalbus ytuae TaxID=2926907 RepID=A0A9E6ZT41_9FLAO|nr:GNAT family N-acetyltransferase [Abyssalbus ytuae]UOB16201.1 GNAT family N-acetyltransferase [Abyssalbus ytuae]